MKIDSTYTLNFEEELEKEDSDEFDDDDEVLFNPKD